jgi:hypothetical protein
VRKYGSTLERSFCTTFSGVGADAKVSFFRNSIHNLSIAVQARVFQRKVGDEWFYIDESPHEPGICRLGTEFERRFDESVSSIAMMTVDEFLQHYHGRRRRVYENAHKSLLQDELTVSDANCKCFLKKEKDIISDKPDAVPRVITFPDPRYGMCFGRFIKAIEHDFFRCIDHVFGSRTVMKGLNYLTLGEEIERKWNRFEDVCSVDGDVSRLDSSISDEMQRFYHTFASKFFESDERDEFLTLCNMQLNVRVNGKSNDGSIKFASSGLGSGQMNTAQMGVFIVCYILFQLKVEHSLDVEVVNCGDDFTVIGDRLDISIFIRVAKEYFKRYNMVLKLEELNEHIEGINFCQTNPVYIDGVLRMVRVPRTAIIKDATSIDLLAAPSQRAKFLHAISCSGIATHGGVPIFQEVYKFMARSAQEVRDQITSKRSLKKTYNTALYDHSMSYWGKGLSCSYKPITDDSRYSFYLAFGYTPFEQESIEDYYRNLTIRDPFTTIDLRYKEYLVPDYCGDKFDW